MTTAAPPTAWLDSPVFRRLAQLSFVFLICFVSALAWSSAPPPQASSGWDKLDHFAAFGTLVCVACAGWGWQCHRRVASWLVAYAVLIECVQSFIPSRTAELGDVLADSIGIALGLVAVRWFLRKTKYF